MHNPDRIKLKSFWKPDGLDFRADLGIMKNAIVVKLFKETLCSKESFYSIAIASFFPFPDEYYKMKFDSYIECCEMAESYVLDWMRSLLVNSPVIDVLSLPDKGSS